MSSEARGIPGDDVPLRTACTTSPFDSEWLLDRKDVSWSPLQQLRQLFKDVDFLRSCEREVISSGASFYVPEFNSANPTAVEFTCFICSKEKDQQTFRRGWRAAYQAMSIVYQFCTAPGRQNCYEISPYIKEVISKMQPNLRWLAKKWDIVL